MRRSITLAAALLAIGVAHAAHADDAACVDSSERALTLRRDGKLRDALKELAVCAAPTCPHEVTEECTRRAGLINAALPTLILSATDEHGGDLLDVKLTLDGAAAGNKLDGRPLTLDPGAHTVKLEANGVTQERTFVLREAEKDRRENFVLARPAPPPPPPVKPPPPPGLGTQKKLALVSGGVAVIGVALGATFGLLANGKKSSEQRDCASSSSCADYGRALSEYGTAHDFATGSTISFVAAAVFLSAGALLFFTAQDPPPNATASSPFRVTF